MRPPAPPFFRIEEVYLWVVVNPDGEGIPAFLDDQGLWQPLMGTARDRGLLRQMARRVTRETGIPLTLYRYAPRERVETT